MVYFATLSVRRPDLGPNEEMYPVQRDPKMVPNKQQLALCLASVIPSERRLYVHNRVGEAEAVGHWTQDAESHLVGCAVH